MGIYQRIVFGLIAVITFSGCNQTDSTELTRDAKKFAETGARALENASLGAKVTTALALRKGIDITRIRVNSEAGTVILSGMVVTKKEKQLVLSVAVNTKGVEKVIDKIETTELSSEK